MNAEERKEKAEKQIMNAEERKEKAEKPNETPKADIKEVAEESMPTSYIVGAVTVVAFGLGALVMMMRKRD